MIASFSCSLICLPTGYFPRRLCSVKSGEKAWQGWGGMQYVYVTPALSICGLPVFDDSWEIKSQIKLFLFRFFL
jgi:hypothetical protein